MTTFASKVHEKNHSMENSRTRAVLNHGSETSAAKESGTSMVALQKQGHSCNSVTFSNGDSVREHKGRLTKERPRCDCTWRWIEDEVELLTPGTRGRHGERRAVASQVSFVLFLRAHVLTQRTQPPSRRAWPPKPPCQRLFFRSMIHLAALIKC